MASFGEYREKFRGVYDAVKHAHEMSPSKNRGHGLDHDVAVAQMAAFLAPDERTADMAWACGIMHSLDRLVDAGSYDAKVDACIALAPGYSKDEQGVMRFAVLEHDKKIPEHRSLVQECLQDADKLVNLQASAILRIGQFRHDIPALEVCHFTQANPASTYHAPCSALDNLRMVYKEYPAMLYTGKARELGAQYAQRLRDYDRQIEEDYRFLGLADADL